VFAAGPAIPFRMAVGMKSPLKLIEDLAREPSEEAMASVVASAVGEGWGVGEMSRLAEVLARSGTTLRAFPD
jgi:hypothetical protein